MKGPKSRQPTLNSERKVLKQTVTADVTLLYSPVGRGGKHLDLIYTGEGRSGRLRYAIWQLASSVQR
jgi:hypothetical protein